MLILAWQWELAHQKSISKYSDDLIEEDAGDNLLTDNLLGDVLLSDNNLVHIDSNIDIDTKAKSNHDEDMIGNKLLEENPGINIKNMF